MVVQDVCFYGAVEDVTADETKVSVNSRGSASQKRPAARAIIGQGEIGMLKECNGN